MRKRVVWRCCCQARRHGDFCVVMDGVYWKAWLPVDNWGYTMPKEQYPLVRLSYYYFLTLFTVSYISVITKMSRQALCNVDNTAKFLFFMV